MKILIKGEEYSLANTVATKITLNSLGKAKGNYDALLKYCYACIFAGYYVDHGKRISLTYEAFEDLVYTEKTNFGDLIFEISNLMVEFGEKERELAERLSKESEKK